MDEQEEQVKPSYLRSREMNEIIGRPPHWLIQWGITLFFIILVMVLALSYFISYPETVTVPFKLVADKPAVPVSVAENGELVKLMVINEGASVNKGDTLFYWRKSNTAQTFPFISPQDGRIIFIVPLHNKLNITKGEFLFYIEDLKTTYYAMVYVKGSAVEKIKVGQRVSLTVAGYPGPEYGSLQGRVGYAGGFTSANGSYVKITLPTGLITDKNKTLTFSRDQNGNAEIIINTSRLINKLLSGMSNKM